MTLRWIYGIIPVPIVYTDDLPERFGGLFCGLWIKIRPKWREDRGLLEHELTHAKQFWKSFGLYVLRYKLSRKWRLKYEVEGYRVQLRFCPTEKTLAYYLLFADFLSTKYNLNVTPIAALNYLMFGIH